jgi:hypothetical protein
MFKTGRLDINTERSYTSTNEVYSSSSSSSSSTSSSATSSSGERTKWK